MKFVISQKIWYTNNKKGKVSLYKINMQNIRLKNNKNFSWKTFRNYLLSYICIMLIPIILNSILSYTLLYNQLKTQEHAARAASISHIEKLLEREFSSLKDIASEISMKACFVKIVPPVEDMDNYYDILEYLSACKAKNNFLYDILYLNLQDETVYTSNSLYTRAAFEQDLYPWKNSNLFHALSQTKQGNFCFLPLETIMQYGQPCEVAAIAVPTHFLYQKGIPKVNGAVTFVVSKETLDTFVKAVSQNTASIEILYSGSKAFYCSRPELLEHLPDFDTLKQSEYLQLGEQNYTVVTSLSSPFPGLIELSPANELTALRNIFLCSSTAIILLAIVICSILIYFFMHMNWKPLKNLSLFVHDQVNGLPAQTDDFESISMALRHLTEKQKELIEHNHTLQKKQCFYFLMNAKPLQSKTLHNQFILAGLNLSGPRYRIMILANKKETAAMLETHFSAESQIYWDNTVISNQIIVLAGGDSGFLDSCAEQVLSWKFECGIGHICDHIAELSESYRHAAQKFYGCSPLKESIPISEIRSACYAIGSGDISRFLFLTREIAGNATLFLKPENAVMIYSLLIGGSFQALHSPNGQLFPNLSEFESKYYTPPSDASSVPSLLLQFAAEIEASMKMSSSRQLSLPLLLDYISNNCFDLTFSLKEMADYFGTTSPNLSHFFKSKTGFSLSKHIQSIRIAKAKDLLSTTGMSVGEIVSLIGYADSSSFIRLFKAECGMTPGEFRDTRQSFRASDKFVR